MAEERPASQIVFDDSSAVQVVMHAKQPLVLDHKEVIVVGAQVHLPTARTMAPDHAAHELPVCGDSQRARGHPHEGARL